MDLGLPDLERRKRLFVAVVFDSLASGIFLPFSVLFFAATTNLGYASIGLGFTLAALIALPIGLQVGRVVDSFGPQPVLIGVNVMRAAAFLGYGFVHNFVVLVIAATVVAVSDTSFWTANSVFVKQVAAPADLTRWFGLERAVRNGGYGLGGLLGGLALVNTADFGRWIVFASAALYLCAAVVLATWRTSGILGSASRRDSGDSSTNKRGFVNPIRSFLTYAADVGLAFSDRNFRLILPANLLFVIVAASINYALAIYVTEQLRLPAVLTGVLFGASTAAVFFLQTIVVRFIELRNVSHILALSGLLWAVGFGMFALAFFESSTVQVVLLVIGIALYSAAELLFNPTMSALVVVAAPDEKQGVFNASYQATWTLGFLITPAATTALLQFGAFACWIVLAILALLAGILMLSRTVRSMGTLKRASA